MSGSTPILPLAGTRTDSAEFLNIHLPSDHRQPLRYLDFLPVSAAVRS
jgi:hypothetical protein